MHPYANFLRRVGRRHVSKDNRRWIGRRSVGGRLEQAEEAKLFPSLVCSDFPDGDGLGLMGINFLREDPFENAYVKVLQLVGAATDLWF